MPDPRLDFVECRTFGHAWFASDWDVAVPTFGLPMAARCERCMTSRYDVFSSGTGELLSRRYGYAEGYRYSAAVERPSRGAFRLMLFERRQRVVSIGAGKRRRRAG